jgi:hypothetical protein
MDRIPPVHEFLEVPPASHPSRRKTPLQVCNRWSIALWVDRREVRCYQRTRHVRACNRWSIVPWAVPREVRWYQRERPWKHRIPPFLGMLFVFYLLKYIDIYDEERATVRCRNLLKKQHNHKQISDNGGLPCCNSWHTANTHLRSWLLVFTLLRMEWKISMLY